MTDRQEKALADLIRYNQMVREGESLPTKNPEVRVKRQAFYLTHQSVEQDEHGLEYCTDCGEGERGLLENICDNFLEV